MKHDLPVGWEIKKLGEVCEFLNRGISPKYLNNGGVQVLNQKCIRDHAINYNLSRRHNDKLKAVTADRFIRLGDVLVNSTGTGTLGRVAQVRFLPNEPSTVDSHVTIVRPKKEKFFIDFFGYALIYIEELIKKAGEGCGGQTELARTVLANNFLISYPTSHTEQQRIVSILDQSFAAIAKAKENAEINLKKSREVFDAYLENIFTNSSDGTEVKRLEDVCEILMGQSPDGNTYNFTGDGTPLINGPVEFSPNPFGSTIRSKYTTQPTKICKKNDLILCVRGSTTGRTNIAGFDACIGRGVAAIRAKIYQPWINYFILCARKEIFSLGTGSTFPNVSGAILGNLKIFFPNVSEQKRIVAIFDELSAKMKTLESIYQRKLVALEELKQSLLEKAFCGELTKNFAAQEQTCTELQEATL